MKLSINERFSLRNILPQEGTMITMRIVRDLQRELSLSDNEITEYEVKMKVLPDGSQGIVWNAEKAKDRGKEIPVGENAWGIVVERLKKLDEMKQINLGLIDLYDRFVDHKCEDKVKADVVKEANKDVELPSTPTKK
jgi:hypothetical protein